MIIVCERVCKIECKMKRILSLDFRLMFFDIYKIFFLRFDYFIEYCKFFEISLFFIYIEFY